MEQRFLIKQSDGGMVGPLTTATIKDLIAAGQIGSDAMVSADRENFVPIWKVPDFAPLVGKSSKAPVASYSGYLSELSFFRVFYRLALAKETGRLLLTRAQQRKEIFFVGGHPVFVGSNIPEERIGEYLVAKRVISRAQLEDALIIVHNFGNHLGNALMQMKVITPHAFYEHLVGQLKDKITAVCGWLDGRYDFYKGTLYEGPKLPVELNPLEILTEGARTKLAPTHVRARLGAKLRKPLVHAERPLIKISELGLNGTEQRIYEAMNEMQTPEDIAHQHVGLDKGALALALCYFLIELELVQPVG